MNQCDCCHKPRRKLHVIMPSDRYIAIDPVTDPGRAIYVCDKWLVERERQKEKRDKRWWEDPGVLLSLPPELETEEA